MIWQLPFHNKGEHARQHKGGTDQSRVDLVHCELHVVPEPFPSFSSSLLLHVFVVDEERLFVRLFELLAILIQILFMLTFSLLHTCFVVMVGLLQLFRMLQLVLETLGFEKVVIYLQGLSLVLFRLEKCLRMHSHSLSH